MPFDDIDRTLLEAIVEVAEASFFAFTGPLDAKGFALLATAPGASQSWFSTTVAFNGDMKGSIEVTVPETLAVSMVGGFLGLEPTERLTPDALRDGMGELANMICGTWLTRACSEGRFDITPPAVATCAAGLAAAPRPGAVAAVHMAVNDQPLRVTVHRS